MLLSVDMMPMILGVMIGYLLGLISLGYLGYRTAVRKVTFVDTLDKTLVGLLLLSAFTLGVFLTFFFRN
jgi:hypothetical protein